MLTQCYILRCLKLLHIQINDANFADPHVRIAGRPEDVQAAKERIMTILNTKVSNPLIFFIL